MIDGTDDQHQRVAIPVGLRDIGRTVYTVGDHELCKEDGVIAFNVGRLVLGKHELIKFPLVQYNWIGGSNADIGFILRGDDSKPVFRPSSQRYGNKLPAPRANRWNLFVQVIPGRNCIVCRNCRGPGARIKGYGLIALDVTSRQIALANQAHMVHRLYLVKFPFA